MAAKKKKTTAPGDLFSSKVPPLAAYLARVGAEELNFRRYMVKDYRGGANYYVERSLIRIDHEGKIHCSREEHAPTDSEVVAIREALQKIELPKSINVPFKEAELFASARGGDCFFFPTRSDANKVILVRERLLKEDGNKAHIPWTYWSDGKWRAMEPDGYLPFWKPPKDRKRPRKMVHEGEKAARFIDDMLHNPEREEEKAAHPWAEELTSYEHWGMIGGALAPHRTDYAELRREAPIEVVYVCDRDYAGESALQEVSRHYGDSMLGIFFGDKFTENWDMADPIPEEFYAGKGKKKRYLGPHLRDLVIPATRATELIGNPSGKGRRIPVLKRAFKEEWLHCIKPEVYVHKDWPHEMWTMPEFNNKVRPFSDTNDTASLLKGDAASKSAVLKYDPSLEPGVYSTGDEGRYINTHRPSIIKAEEGDASPWEEFIEALVPDPHDRTELIRWCATLIALPSVRMTYGVLLISEQQGVGKGTLGEKILAPLVGETNVSYPSEQEIVDSNFNYWLAHKRLAVVHEIYAGHSQKAYNRLKSLITDRYVTVSKKYMANYDMENWIHMYANSNSMRAIQLTMEDRRWLVPRITETKRSAEYWIGFNRWLRDEGGLAKIKWWCIKWLEKNKPVERGADSPWTTLKREVIEEGYSPGQALVAKTLDRITNILGSTDEEDVSQVAKWRQDGMVVNGHSVAILDTDLVRLITDVIHQGRPSDRLERPLTIRKLAKQCGWNIGQAKVSTGMRTWGANAHNGRVISNDPVLASLNPTELGGAKSKSDIKIKPLNLDFAREV